MILCFLNYGLQDYSNEMKKIYLDTERQFLEFTYVVPIDENQKLYSPRLYSLLQFTCSQIDSLMKNIVDELQLKLARKNSFKNLFCSLNWCGMLNLQSVFFYEIEKEIQPFRGNFNLEWWIAYNKTKHGLPSGMKKATMKNVISALAGAYILNGIVHTLSYAYASKNKLSILDNKNWGKTTVDETTIHNIRMLRNYENTVPFISNFFSWLCTYHNPRQPSAPI